MVDVVLLAGALAGRVGMREAECRENSPVPLASFGAWSYVGNRGVGDDESTGKMGPLENGECKGQDRRMGYGGARSDSGCGRESTGEQTVRSPLMG